MTSNPIAVYKIMLLLFLTFLGSPVDDIVLKAAQRTGRGAAMARET